MVDSKTPLIVPTPHLHPLPLSEGERREKRAGVCTGSMLRDQATELTNAQYPVAGPTENPSNCVILRL
jgi:hypothetical protein